MSNKSIFEMILDGEVNSNIIYENEYVFAINDLNPVAKVHILIIPKKKIESINFIEQEDSKILSQMFLTAKLLAKKYEINNSTVLLVDDVMQSGKTLQFVISNLIKFNPSKIKTSVIVNRDQTLFPVKVDFSGVKLSTSVNEHVDFIVDDKKEFSVFLS